MTVPQDDNHAVPVSPPFWCRASNSYALRIEYRSEEYLLKWTNPLRQPSLPRFPQLEPGIISEKVEHSEEEAEVWASTHLRAFGSYAHVRKASRSSFPMCKIAYCTEASLFFIRNEFQILQQLRSSALPIVKVGDPLIDENGIFGFTMEELHPIKPEDIPLYYKDMKDALDKVHKQGYVHADVTVSNFMQTDEGNVRIIDFGQAGNDGEPLPKQHPLLKLGKQKFEVDMDFEGLERIKQRVGWIESTS